MKTFIVSCFLLAAAAFAQLPNPEVTPGVVRTTDASEICARSFRTKPFRKTTSAMKKQACAEYGIKACPKQGVMEIDHLLPLELGGLDDVRNLWPQLANYPDGSPGFHVKDKLENQLKKLVCSQQMSLPAAQECIQSNWIDCYTRVFGTNIQIYTKEKP
jgi:hypothetical protein